VFPDGRMETTYHLRPGISWHDGEPFSAEDFAFAWRVYSAPELGQAASSPLNRMEDVSAADPRTLIIRWKQPYPDIELAWDAFPPLPRHILEGSFQQLPSGGFPSQPYWTREYVGLGPYRLERWEPGAFLEAAAFDGHVLGRAKIERIKIQFIPDGNTALASLLSGQIDVAADSVFQFSQSLLIKQDWVPRTGGVVLFHAN